MPKTVPTTTRPAELHLDGTTIVIEKSSFPINPIWDQVISDLGDPTTTPVLSMRARAEARVARDGGTVDNLVWLFDDKATDG